MINVDKDAAYPVEIDALKAEETIEQETELRQNKYLNNVVEKYHQNIKHIAKPIMGLKTLKARKTLSGIKTVNMIWR